MQPYIKHIRALPLTSILITTIVLILFYLNIFKAIDNGIYDFYMSINAMDIENKNIFIIEIDDYSIKNLGSYPLKRSYIGTLLEKLSKYPPATIGINILFSEPTKDDELLIKPLKLLHDVVTPFAVYIDGKTITFPLQVIQENSKLADSSLTKDNDGVVRRSRKEIPGNDKYITFAAQLGEYFLPGITSNIPAKDFFYINFFHPTKYFPHYSFFDVYNGKVNPRIFQNKIVLIGPTAETVLTHYSIPLSSEKSISGTELQAHIVNTFINKKFIWAINPFILVFLLLVSSLWLELILKTKKPDLQGIYTITYILLSILLSYLLFSYCLLYAPPSIFIISGVLIYAIYAFKTLSKIDRTVDKAITELADSSHKPLVDISDQIEKGVITLSELSQIINKDRQMIKAILNAINSPVILIDNSSKIIWKNHQTETSRTFNTIVSLTDLWVDLEKLKEEIKLHNFYKQELSLDDKDFLMIVTPSGDNNPDYVCIFNDITELKNIDRLKTDLIRTVSHEIRTPLTIIQSYCDLGLEMNDGTTALQYLDKISNKTEELTFFVTDFLDLNKLEANMVELNFEKLHLLPFVKNILKDMLELASKKNINLLFNSPEDKNIFMKADPNRLKQVFVNLISNAIKYSSNEKNVTISIDKDEEHLTIAISDEGFGMSEEDKAKIFNKFYRVKSEQTKGISGTGLGLSIVKKIVEMHQGQIIVESQLGQGTTFNLTFKPENE